ncbi:MAG: hypothetical protein HRT44_09735, partial [Bdellovibrionales bacterium]|nr:hypothetical protein [Bdellovibrionales bacterium]
MKKIAILLLSLMMISCGQQEATTGSDEDLATSVEDAVTTISALMDDQEG